MKLLDWYILKRFLLTYFFVVMVIVLVVCVVDYTEKVDDFYKHKAPGDKIIFDYYFQLHPVLGQLHQSADGVHRHGFYDLPAGAKSEIIAMLSSGMSFVRLLVPYSIGALILSIATYFLWAGWFRKPTRPGSLSS